MALTGAALAVALIVTLVVAWRKGTVPLAWAASSLGVLGLAAAVAGGTTRFLDLATVAGVVLVGGVAGAGWAPRGRVALLVAGLLGLAAGTYAHFVALEGIFTEAGFGWAAGAEAVPGQLAWGVARASGFVAFLAATAAVILGTRRPSALPIGGLPARVYALHRALGISAVLAMAVHLGALWADDFVEFAWRQLLLTPWTSSYEPFAVTLGWLAMISLVLTAASGGLRRLLPGGTWRIVHALAYLTFALGLVHGLLAGSDSGTPAALAFYLTALLVVAWAAYRRLFSPKPPYRRDRKKAVAKDRSVRRDKTAIRRDETTLR
jgi:sulfoxide reductase heme-binding subunit YedZ